MDKYEKIRIVGRGAYGIVHLCQRLSDKKLVIIKQIPVEQMTKDERQAALNEVKVLSMLDSPNIIKYYENYLEDKALMIVMEYAPGGTLYEFLQQRNGQLLEEGEILAFFVQMLLALQHVHSKQILHRDLKSQNILLDKRKKVIKIGDFGISKVLSSKSKAYTVVGTPCYISPELCEGKPYNQASDIWALGCVLYELASLQRAFEAQTLPALILKIMRGTFSPISDKYSAELHALILSLLHLDPIRRPTVNQILSQPIMLSPLIHMYTDFGKVPCRPPRQLSAPSVKGRSSKSSGKGGDGELQCKPVSCHLVYCWGNGQSRPTLLPLPTADIQVVQVAAGRTQKAAVTKSGRLLIWENNMMGGDGVLPGSVVDSESVFVPRYLEGQSGVTIKHVACGHLFTTCLTDRGILMTYGNGTHGCLGHGNFHDVTQAKIVEALLGFEVVHVACGSSHVIAVTGDCEVFVWGRGDNGRLGLGTDEELFCTPQQLRLPSSLSPVQAFCGVDCSMLLTSAGQLLAAGNNRFNKIALDRPGSRVDEMHTFQPLEFPLCDLHVKMVSLGTSHSALVTDSGLCYTFGSPQFGQLGYIHEGSDSRCPRPVEELKDQFIELVACGDTFTVAVTREGVVFSWGKNTRGRLGRPGGDSATPAAVQLNSDGSSLLVTSLSCSHGVTLLACRTE